MDKKALLILVKAIVESKDKMLMPTQCRQILINNGYKINDAEMIINILKANNFLQNTRDWSNHTVRYYTVTKKSCDFVREYNKK